MEHSGNISIFNTSGTSFGNILWNFIENFFRISQEYIIGIFHEFSRNMYLRGGYKSESLATSFSERKDIDFCSVQI